MNTASRLSEQYASQRLYATYCRMQRAASPMGTEDTLITHGQLLAHFGLWCAGKYLEASPFLYGDIYLHSPQSPVVRR